MKAALRLLTLSLFPLCTLFLGCSSEQTSSDQSRSQTSSETTESGDSTAQSSDEAQSDASTARAPSSEAPSKVSIDEAQNDVMRCAEYFASRINDESTRSEMQNKLATLQTEINAFAVLRERANAERDLGKRFTLFGQVAGAMLEAGATPRALPLLGRTEKVLDRLLTKTAADTERQCQNDGTPHSFCNNVASDPVRQLEGEFEDLAELFEQAGLYHKAYVHSTNIESTDQSSFLRRHLESCGLSPEDELIAAAGHFREHAAKQLGPDHDQCESTHLALLFPSEPELVEQSNQLHLELLLNDQKAQRNAVMDFERGCARLTPGLPRARAKVALATVLVATKRSARAKSAIAAAAELLARAIPRSSPPDAQVPDDGARAASILATLALAVGDTSTAHDLLPRIETVLAGEELIALKVSIHTAVGENATALELIESSPADQRPVLLARMAIALSKREVAEESTTPSEGTVTPTVESLLERAWVEAAALGEADDASSRLDALAFAHLRSKSYDLVPAAVSKLRGKVKAPLINNVRSKLANALAREPNAKAARSAYILLTRIRPTEDARIPAETLFENLMSQGRTVLAIRTIEAMDTPRAQAVALSKVADYLTKTGRIEPAVGEKRALAKLIESSQ